MKMYRRILLLTFLLPLTFIPGPSLGAQLFKASREHVSLMVDGRKEKARKLFPDDPAGEYGRENPFLSLFGGMHPKREEGQNFKASIDPFPTPTFFLTTPLPNNGFEQTPSDVYSYGTNQGEQYSNQANNINAADEASYSRDRNPGSESTNPGYEGSNAPTDPYSGIQPAFQFRPGGIRKEIFGGGNNPWIPKTPKKINPPAINPVWSVQKQQWEKNTVSQPETNPWLNQNFWSTQDKRTNDPVRKTLPEQPLGNKAPILAQPLEAKTAGWPKAWVNSRPPPTDAQVFRKPTVPVQNSWNTGYPNVNPTNGGYPSVNPTNTGSGYHAMNLSIAPSYHSMNISVNTVNPPIVNPSGYPSPSINPGISPSIGYSGFPGANSASGYSAHQNATWNASMGGWFAPPTNHSGPVVASGHSMDNSYSWWNPTVQQPPPSAGYGNSGTGSHQTNTGAQSGYAGQPNNGHGSQSGYGSNGGSYYGVQTTQAPLTAPTVEQCFQAFPNCILVNVAPLRRLMPVSVEECLKACLEESAIGDTECRAVVHVPQYQSCDLFGQNGTELGSNARIIMLFGYNYYTPKYEPNCDDLANQKLTNSEEFIGPKPPITTTKITTRTITTTIATTTAEPFEPEPVDDDCPDDKFAVFQKAPGYFLMDSNGFTLEGSTESECRDFCTYNEHPDGSGVRCRSFDFNPDTGTCILSPEAAVPQRNGMLKRNARRVYYEKICVSETAFELCLDSTLDREPQKIMLGSGESVETTVNMQDCVELCFGSPELFGFSCLSILYFYEEPELNCILLTNSRNTEPEFYVSEETNRVEYVGIDSCFSQEEIFLRNEAAGPPQADRPKTLRPRNQARTTADREAKRPTTTVLKLKMTPRVRKNLDSLKSKEIKRRIRIRTEPLETTTKPPFSLSSADDIEQAFKKLNFATKEFVQSSRKRWEWGGGRRRTSTTTTVGPPSQRPPEFKLEVLKVAEDDSSLLRQITVELGHWLEWSKCDRSAEGRRKRYRHCNAPKLDLCPFETEWCGSETPMGQKYGMVVPVNEFFHKNVPIVFYTQPPPTLSVLEKSRDQPTQTNTSSTQQRVLTGKCLPYKGSCRVGIRYLKNGSRRLCTVPRGTLCDEGKNSKH